MGKAKETYKKGLQIWQNVFGENHPNTSISYNNLADIYVKQGKYKQAEGLHKRSLQIREQVLGEDYPDTAIGYNKQIVHKNMKITFCEWDTEGNFEQWLKENMKESD